MTFVETEILNSSNRTIRQENHKKLIDYLIKYHPIGFKQPCTIAVNENYVELENLDMNLKEGDLIGIVFHPHGGVVKSISHAVSSVAHSVSHVLGGAAQAIGIIAFLPMVGLTLIAQATQSYIITELFGPDIESYNAGTQTSSLGNKGQASTVYSLNSKQNSAKIGASIPIVYGRVRIYPSLISQSYFRYDGNEEYLYQLMCIGHGTFDIEKMMISDTDINIVNSNYFRYEKLELSDFGTKGGIAAKVNDSNYVQIVKTIPDVSNLEVKDGTTYGPYHYEEEHIGFEVDYLYNGGVYGTNTSNGNFKSRTTTFQITYFDGTTSVSRNITTTASDNDPIRRTFRIMYPSPHNVEDIRIKRITTEATNTQSYDKLTIRSVKFLHAEPDYSTLGNITLLWCKIKATNAISSTGQFAINSWVKRNDVQNDVKSVLVDLYSNDNYGGRLPASDLNFSSTPNSFVNGAFDNQMTLFDMMKTVAKSNRFTVYPNGAEILLKYDGIKPIRTSLFNETNMIADSFKINYLFEEPDDTDSFRINYMSHDDFKQEFEIYPAHGIFPKTKELWGCTDATIAMAMAKYLYKQTKSRRKTIEFKTDIQGLIPQFLDRIAISHNLPEWGFGGQIASFSGRDITLTCDYDAITPSFWVCDDTYVCGDVFFPTCPLWKCADTYACNDVFFPSCRGVSAGAEYNTIIFRDAKGGLSSIYEFDAISQTTIRLRTDPPTWLYDGFDYDKTYFSIGQNHSFVRDYIVTNIKPNGDEVTIQAVNYDESIYS